MHQHPVTVARTLAAAAAAIVIAACGSSKGTAPSTALPPDTVQQQVAQTVATSIATQVSAFTELGAGAFITPFIGAFDVTLGHGHTALGDRVRLATTRIGAPRADLGADCPTTSPASPADADADNVPDNVTFTYTTANCTDVSPDLSLSLSGTFTVSDPTTGTADLDYAAQVANLAATFSGNGTTAQLGANGTISVAESPGQIVETSNYSLAFAESAPVAAKDSLAGNITATFTFPAGPSPLVDGDPLPAGTFVLSGSESFTIDGTTYAFTVATPTALSIDPDCPSSVTAGAIQLTFDGASTAVETITWTACGAFTVTHN